MLPLDGEVKMGMLDSWLNMNDRVQDDEITAIFETVANLRKEYKRKATRK
jgi:hypothetical protein